MQLIKRNNLLLLFLLLIEFTVAQQFPSKNYSTLDGLSNNTIRDVFKDSRGILWIGSDRGVSKIQNGTIKNFYDTDGLAYYNCWSITEDSNHVLWFGSYGGGLTVYNGQTFKIINHKDGLIDDLIRKLFTYKNNVFVGTESGISVIDINTKKIQNFKEIGRRGRFQIMGFFEHKNEFFCSTLNDGIWKIDLKNHKLIVQNKNMDDQVSVYKDRDSIWYGCDIEKRSVNRLSVDNYIHGVRQQSSFGTSFFWDFVKDKRNCLYGSADQDPFPNGGIFKIGNNEVINYNKNFGVESTSSICLDYDKTNDLLFVGTSEKGLYEIDLKQHVKYFSRSYYNKTRLDIIAFDKLDNNVVVLHKDGVLILNNDKVTLDLSKKSIYSYAHNFHLKYPKNEKYIYYEGWLKQSLEDVSMTHLKIYKNQIWINTSIGLFKLNKNGKIEDYQPLLANVFDFVTDNNLLYQKSYGFVYLDENYTQNSIPKEIPSDKNLKPKDITKFIWVKDKLYMVSYFDGLFTYKNGVVKSYFKNNIWKERNLGFAKLNYKDQLVISNKNGNVFVIDDSNKFKIVESIPNNKIVGTSISFLETYRDYIIIGTEKGINIYKDGVLRFLDEEQGFKNKIFTSSTIINDLLYVGTQNGFYQLDLKKYLTNKTSAPIIKIDKIEINYKPISNDNFVWFNYKRKTIELPYNKNTISVSFYPQNRPYPNKLKYLYKLIGLNNIVWSNWSSDRRINIPYLPNGTFKIILQVKDLYSGNSSTQTILNIVINPPFWKTWWFIIIGVCFIVTVGFLIYKKRISVIQKQERYKSEIQKRLNETKMEALQSQMSPHFLHNSLNNMSLYVIDNNIDEALNYMTEFSRLIRLTLDNSSKFKISLQEEINYLITYVKLENKRYKDRVKFHLTVEDSIDVNGIQILPMLIQPLIENVFVHAFNSSIENPTLEVNFNKINNILLCEVKDNGKGISSDRMNKLHSSKGIKLVKERIQLYQKNSNESVIITSAPKEGTTVVLKIELSV